MCRLSPALSSMLLLPTKYAERYLHAHVVQYLRVLRIRHGYSVLRKSCRFHDAVPGLSQLNFGHISVRLDMGRYLSSRTTIYVVSQ